MRYTLDTGDHIIYNWDIKQRKCEKMGYAFVSYSSKNASAAKTVREILVKRSVNIWMAPYDIPAGSKYAAVINRAVRDCACFLLLLTNEAQESNWVE
jgi:hypothetical protein